MWAELQTLINEVEAGWRDCQLPVKLIETLIDCLLQEILCPCIEWIHTSHEKENHDSYAPNVDLVIIGSPIHNLRCHV